MKISGPGTVRPAERARSIKARGGGRESFTVKSPAEGGGEAPITKVMPLASVDALIALQEVDDENDQRRAALDHGEDLLSRLDEIRHGLLIGSIPRHRLKSLAQAARRQLPDIQDSRLAEILREIELRAAVELAKYERAQGQIR